MELLSHEAFGVLNALYLRKIADGETLAECSGQAAPAVGETLDAMASAGSVLVLDTQYMLTDEGRQAVLDYYDETYRELRKNPEVEEWYTRFETVNERFLQLVSAWQTDQDEKVLDRIIKLVEKHIAALDEAASWLERYSHYAARFRRSLERFEAGKTEYLTSPTVDSLHNIWFEFHEDILALLGRPRETVS